MLETQETQTHKNFSFQHDLETKMSQIIVLYFDCMLLSCHVRVSGLNYTLQSA